MKGGKRVEEDKHEARPDWLRRAGCRGKKERQISKHEMPIPSSYGIPMNLFTV